MYIINRYLRRGTGWMNNSIDVGTNQHLAVVKLLVERQRWQREDSHLDIPAPELWCKGPMGLSVVPV